MRRSTFLAVAGVAVLFVAATFLVELSQEPKPLSTKVQCTDTIVTIGEGSSLVDSETYVSFVSTATYTSSTNVSATVGLVVTSAGTQVDMFGVYTITSHTCTYLG